MKWQRTGDWVGSEIDDSFVMVHLETGKYVALNATAAAVWNALEEPSDEDAIVDRLVAEFDIGQDECRESLRRLIADLEQRQLVEPA